MNWLVIRLYIHTYIVAKRAGNGEDFGIHASYNFAWPVWCLSFRQGFCVC